MDEQAFKRRTKQLGLRVIRVVQSLGNSRVEDVIGRQLVKCGTSVGANYPAPCRARSIAEIIAKLGIVEDEADETLYWLEMLIEAECVSARKLRSLMDEADQILATVVASIKTLKRRMNAPRRQSKIPNLKSKISHA